MGKLIVIWNPITNRTGCTTVSISVATALSWWANSNKKTLLINCSNTGRMEDYMNIDVKYTLDYLNVLKDDITPENVGMIATPINDKLDIIGGMSIDENIRNSSNELILDYIDKSLKRYDCVILDMSNHFDTKILEKADILIPVIYLDKFSVNRFASNNHQSQYINNSLKTITVISNIHERLKNEITLLNNLVNNPHILISDVNIYYRTSIEPSLYAYLVENLNSKNDPYIESLLDLTFEILKIMDNALDMNQYEDQGSRFKKLFKIS